MTEASYKTKQSDLLYDYIKFHIGLYIGTPAIYSLIGQSQGLTSNTLYLIGLTGLLVFCFIAGASASLLISKYLFVKWTDYSEWDKLGETANNVKRRAIQHWSYWLAISWGIIFLILSIATMKTPG